MIIKGRCRGKGAQLGRYLLDTVENDRAELLAIHGTSVPSDIRLALLEMSLTSEITGRTKNGLYHAQLSPRTEEARDMEPEQKLRMVEILTKHLELPENVKFVLCEQEKDDRIHFHLAYERYNHDTGKMWSDHGNYAKHKAAAREMEIEFGWKLTYDKTNRLDRDIKDHLWDVWHKEQDAASYVKEMEKYGFEVTQGIDKRPFQIVDQHGTVFDLTRQLDGVRQKEVSERLNQIRDSLRTTTEVSKEHRREAERLAAIEKEKNLESDKYRDLSDSQNLSKAMIDKVKRDKLEQQEATKEKFKGASYGFKFEQKLEQSPSLPQDQELKKQSDKSREMSDSQDLAAAMIESIRKREINPITGKEMSEEASEIIRQRREQERIKREQRQNRDIEPGYDL